MNLTAVKERADSNRYTEFTLPSPYTDKTFDFVMVNDVAEHIQKDRYGCFFQQLREVTHDGSLVYMHTPNPQARLADSGQYYENVLPHHFVVMGMALVYFEVVLLEQDNDTRCRGGQLANKELLPTVLDQSNCKMNGYVKYYHVVFRRVDKLPLFELK
jgi:hypothetical protein